MDLVRRILLTIEVAEARYEKVNVPGYSDAVVNYHLDLLFEARLANGEMQWMNRGRGVPVVRGLTWEGHDFLDAIRNESIWAKTKDFVKERGLQSIPVELIKSLATDFVKQQLGV